MNEIKTPWDLIPGFSKAKCCGTCDCAMSNTAIADHNRMLTKEGLDHMPGMSYPYPIWCEKYEAETCKLGDCPGWEED